MQLILIRWLTVIDGKSLDMCLGYEILEDW